MSATFSGGGPPVVNVSLAARQYILLGWVLVAFDKQFKGPQHEGWNKRENCIDDVARALNLFGNIGLCHAYSGTCAIDLDDIVAAIVSFWLAGIDLQKYLDAGDAVLLLSGRENRGKLLFRLPPGISPLPSKMFKADGFELRCGTAGGLSMQDVLPPSTHPLTGKNYYWGGKGDWRNPPYLPADILAYWQSLIAKPRSDGRALPEGFGRDDLLELLEQVPTEKMDYAEWLKVAMALHYETAGSDIGLDLLDDWSARKGGKGYTGYDHIASKWYGFNLDHPNPVTLRSVVRLLNHNMEDEYEALPDVDPPEMVEQRAAVKAEAPVTTGALLHVKPVDVLALSIPPPDPDIIVENLLLMDACGFVAPGGTGKTTLAIYEAVHIILGRPLWGRRVIKPGPILFLTAEDSRQILESRLFHICRALRLKESELQIVADGFYIEDLSTVNMRLVGVDPKGAVRPTTLVSHLIEQYRPIGVRLVHLDPASLLGPGETSGNDGMAELMRTARQIALALKAACQIVHHVAQAVARGGIQDQYAGRGGTAFADNSRGQRQLVRIKGRDYEFNGKMYRIPDFIEDDLLERGRILAILVHKLSYVEVDPHPIFILRDGFSFLHFEADVARPKAAMSFDQETAVLVAFIEKGLANGEFHSARSLSARCRDIGLGQKKIRDLVEDGIDRGIFEWHATPKGAGRGGKSKHLVVAEDGGSDL